MVLALQRDYCFVLKNQELVSMRNYQNCCSFHCIYIGVYYIALNTEPVPPTIVGHLTNGVAIANELSCKSR
jgi:hypothetical protein